MRLHPFVSVVCQSDPFTSRGKNEIQSSIQGFLEYEEFSQIDILVGRPHPLHHVLCQSDPIVPPSPSETNSV